MVMPSPTWVTPNVIPIEKYMQVQYWCGALLGKFGVWFRFVRKTGLLAYCSSAYAAWPFHTFVVKNDTFSCLLTLFCNWIFFYTFTLWAPQLILDEKTFSFPFCDWYEQNHTENTFRLSLRRGKLNFTKVELRK